MVRALHDVSLLHQLEDRIAGLDFLFDLKGDFCWDYAAKQGVVSGGSSILYPCTISGMQAMLKLAVTDDDYCVPSVTLEIENYRILAGLPGVMMPLGAGLTQGSISLPYIILPRQDHNFSQKMKTMSLEEEMTQLRCTAQTVGLIHGRGLVHQDATPANIYPKTSGNLIADFGITMRAGERMEKPIWCFGYSSPEQVAGLVDYSNDLWALGMTWAQILIRMDKTDVFNGYWRNVYSNGRTAIEYFDGPREEHRCSVLHGLGISTASEYRDLALEVYGKSSLIQKLIDPSIALFHDLFKARGTEMGNIDLAGFYGHLTSLI